MATSCDGPISSLFAPLPLRGNVRFEDLAEAGVSEEMADALPHAPTGRCASWGIEFNVGESAILLQDKPVRRKVKLLKTRWLVFMHTTDAAPLAKDSHGFVAEPMRGSGRLGQHVANYHLHYADGSSATAAIRRRHEIGMFWRGWGENCVECVSHVKPRPLVLQPEDEVRNDVWRNAVTMNNPADRLPWCNWVWAWENPHPGKAITAITFEPIVGTTLLCAVSAGNASTNPLRWQSRRKAVLTLPRGQTFEASHDEHGLWPQVQIDMGQIIVASPRPVYPNDKWSRTYNNQLPEMSDREVLVEYAAHEDARFHLSGGRTVPVAKVQDAAQRIPLRPVDRATQRVTIRAVEKGSRKPVAVRLHVHGEAGEYLAPVDRHRIPNPHWFQDYSVDFTHMGLHHSSYVDGEAVIDLPLGRVYIEVSKGFEIRPVRKAVRVTRATREINVEIEHLLPWRERGWVSADTHVHFLSPTSALLEGAGEGVNVVNLLASQWGELMTNVGDFDGRTTHGSREAGGNGETLVRVGTENRQHVLGHISLLGYEGRIIAPMTTGGPDESAIGDPVEILLAEWARQCKRQGGVVVLPHFPNPRMEGAAAVIRGDADAVEMTAWSNLYGGIDPYSLSDWYRYLNCGYFVAAVGGTDKMTASTAVGTVRTYARIDGNREFDYDAWKEAVEAGRTFVTYGPLMEFAVDGQGPGSRIAMRRTGGTIDVEWKAESVTVPMSRVELIVGGEVRESVSVAKWQAEGRWSLPVDQSTWVALLVRGHYADKPEIVAAHSSPVMVQVAGTPYRAPADAMTILEQIEGSLAWLDTLGTRAEAKAYKRMRMLLTGVHRELHNRMHQMGQFHEHSPVDDHAEHH